ncbi:hypothetical protein LJR235_001385 [Pararhizobium sp. LjRoot235]|uniref:hypothetical protein n=1 Tax=Pararhizobium sp. LjRoot235 TaxID=3342291 RepID=UPI003ECC42E4
MTPKDRDELFAKVETAGLVFRAATASARLAFLSLIEDISLDQDESSDKLDFDIEEARYRLRAAVRDEGDKTLGFLDVIGE